MLDADGWERLRASIWRPPLERRAVRERLLRLAGAVREWTVEARPLAAEWQPLGIEVRQARIRGRGLCAADPESRVVYVNADDPYELQRFTVAHEVAHLLLAGGRWQPRRILSPPAEEALCEEFAGRLLIDPLALSARLRVLGLPPTAADLLRLCGEFRVNVRPMMIAVGEQLEHTPHCLLLARWRGHPRRPREEEFRVEAHAGGRHLYFPRHQRLASLGLASLAEDARRASHGDLICGGDDPVEIGLRNLPGERSSATARGPVAWSASRQGRFAPFVLAVLDLGERACAY